jgi:hypothetical protein
MVVNSIDCCRPNSPSVYQLACQQNTTSLTRRFNDVTQQLKRATHCEGKC